VGYTLGVDLGTTYTAAAVIESGRPEVVELGLRTSTVPSVVLLREDETMLTGEAASRRALTEPDRVAREFKRRVGDTTPLLLGGTPMSAEALMARLLRSVVDTVSERHGGPPDRVAVCHPANWGPYKTDLLRQAVRLAGLESAVLLTEPEAAAIHYAAQERVEPGSVIAVYDLGGGTFDAAVLRKTADGWEVLGQPEGIERLGGVDFDAAVFAHVERALAGKLAELDPDDPVALSALTRLREECVEAKESLSADDEVSIPVLLPNVQTEVVLRREDFERLIRPALQDSLEALRRALVSAGVDATQLSAVLLVGGSSRIPLVARMVEETLGRPVALDVHPKHAVPLGAALAAVAATADTAPVVTPPPVTAPPPVVTPPPVAAAPSAPGDPNQTVLTPVPGTEVPNATAPPPAPAPPPVAAPVATGAAPTPEVIVLPPVDDLLASGQAVQLPTGTDGADGSGGGNRRVLVLVLGAVAGLVLVGGAVAALGGGDDGGGTDVAAVATTGPESADWTEPVEGSDATDPATPTTAYGGTQPPATYPASVPDTGDDGMAADCDRNHQICITGVEWDGDDLTAYYETNKDLTLEPEGDHLPADSFHAHFYFGPDTTADTSGTQAPEDERGTWQIWATEGVFAPSYASTDVGEAGFTRADVGTNTDLCVTVANERHESFPDTEYCVPLPWENGSADPLPPG
jgi:actin-like ATPase involved in cell morphogenesis